MKYSCRQSQQSVLPPAWKGALLAGVLAVQTVSGCSHSETRHCTTKDDCNADEDCLNNTCVPADPCRDVTCDPGRHCEEGTCVPDGCGDDDCSKAPDDFCLDGQTLRRFSSPGTCRNDECNYDYEDVTCPDGCSEGTCVNCTPDGACPQDWECGDYEDACGQTYHCGDCPSWQSCQSGVCQTTAPVLHVAPDGSGTDCSQQRPCSLTQARSLVRQMAPQADDDIHVVLAGGTYELDAPFELQPQDSGRNGHKVIYEAAPSEQPVLDGGLAITGWTIHDAAKGIYMASVPPGLETRQLYIDGRRMIRAGGRWSPPGFTVTEDGYQAPNADMASWGNPTDIEFVDLDLWRTYRCPVASISGTQITMAQPCWHRTHLHQNHGMGLPDWIENAYELLDAPGEWYLDRNAGLLFVIFPEGTDPNSAEVVVPKLETLLRIEGTADQPVHDITFSGISFAHATWLRPSSNEGYPCRQSGILSLDTAAQTFETPGNVTMTQGHDITFERCRFEHLGAAGLVVERGSHDVVVNGCTFQDISGGAVRIGNVDAPNPTDSRDVTRDNVVSNCLVTACGREFFDGVGLFAGYTDGTHFLHNEIRNVPYSGMSVGWGWSTASTVARNNEVAFNLGAHVMQRLHDGGQIYTLSNQPDSSIHDNFFSSQIHVYGSIYLDQGTQHYRVTNNVVLSAPYWFIAQPTVAPRASQNEISHNWSDRSDDLCCGNLGCCTDVNTVEDNQVFSPGHFPVPARRIADQAGIEEAYADIRPDSILVEAEDYDQGGEGIGYHDLLPENQGNSYRNDDVDIYRNAFRSNAHNVGYTQTGEWLAYSIDLRPGGHYDVTFQVGVRDPGCRIDLELDGRMVDGIDLPVTGSWSTYEAVAIPDIVVPTGPHRLRLIFTGGFTFDFFTYTLTDSRCDPTGQIQPAARIQGDFDGDGTSDNLAIYQDALCWEVTTTAGPSIWLTTWGRGSTNLPGDFDGDGKQDILVVYRASDQQWHWHLALSTGRSFVPIPDALVGQDPGTQICAKDYDNDGIDEIVVESSTNACMKLDTSTWHLIPQSNCAATCN